MTFGKVLYWTGLAVAILTVVGLPIWAFGGWMGSKAFTEKNRDLWMGRGIGCWLGLFALFLFLLPARSWNVSMRSATSEPVSLSDVSPQGRGVGDAGRFSEVCTEVCPHAHS